MTSRPDTLHRSGQRGRQAAAEEIFGPQGAGIGPRRRGNGPLTRWADGPSEKTGYSLWT